MVETTKQCIIKHFLIRIKAILKLVSFPIYNSLPIYSFFWKPARKTGLATSVSQATKHSPWNSLVYPQECHADIWDSRGCRAIPHLDLKIRSPSVCGGGTVVHVKDWGWSACLQRQNWKPCTAAIQMLRVYYGTRFTWHTSGREEWSRTGIGQSSKQDFFTTRTLFIHGASAQTLTPILEVDFFPAFQRHSSVRTPTVHLNFSTWVFSCVWYLQGQNLWLCLSSIIHLSYEEQEDCDTKKKPKPKDREVLFSFNCLKKHLPPGPLWIYAKRERMQPLNSNWDKSFSSDHSPSDS